MNEFPVSRSRLHFVSPSSSSSMKIENSLSAPQLPDAPSQAGLHFSVATEEDFDEIMAMSQHIYGGLDYLPTRYGAWMQETNRTVVLARKQGKVVGGQRLHAFTIFSLKSF